LYGEGKTPCSPNIRISLSNFWRGFAKVPVQQGHHSMLSCHPEQVSPTQILTEEGFDSGFVSRLSGNPRASEEQLTF
jgi:hypothetical protein